MAGSAFDLQSMAVEFQVGEKKLVLLPMKLKSFRRVIDMMEDLADKARALPPGAKIKALAGVVLEKQEEALNILFPGAELTHEFIDENMTISQVKEILGAAVKMNGLDQWYPDLLQVLGVKPADTL